MKVVWSVSWNRWNSALSEYALAVARSLEHSSHYQHFFTPLAESVVSERASKMNLSLYPEKKLSWRNVGKYYRLYQQLQPEVIVVFGGAELSAALLLRCFVSFRLVRVIGDVRPRRQRGFGRFLAMILSCSNKLVVPSQAVRSFLPAKGLLERCRVIELGIDCPQQAGGVTMPPRPYFLIFGRFDPVKGHEVFFQIFKKFLQNTVFTETLPRPLLRVVGLEANLSRHDLEQQAVAAGLDVDDVSIECRRISDVPSLMTLATLGVVSSIGSEWICRVGQEFLVCGTPVFVSGVGALNELLVDPSCGRSYLGLEPQEAALRLAELYQKVLGSEDDPRLLSQKKFGIERMKKEWEELLNL